MTNRKYYYFVEGQCEEKLVKALKLNPALLMPGKVKIFNVVQNIISLSILMSIEPGSAAVLIFDTDKAETDHLKSNINSLKKRCSGVDVLTILQVLNFEDEIERTTDVKNAENLTKSKTVEDFKSTVNRIKDVDFRRMLERHRLDMNELWEKSRPKRSDSLRRTQRRLKPEHRIP